MPPADPSAEPLAFTLASLWSQPLAPPDEPTRDALLVVVNVVSDDAPPGPCALFAVAMLLWLGALAALCCLRPPQAQRAAPVVVAGVKA